MANISPKLFQKAIQKGLKTALFTTSTAALMLTGSGALGAARTVTADGAELAAGTNIGPAVKGKNYNSFNGLLGGKVSSNINVNEEVVLTPELYAMVDYAFKNKVPAIDARLQGMTAPFPTNSFKQSKTSFDVGVGVTAKHKMMEYGINYDTNIGSKYFAQQGSVKVRVNF